MSPIAPHLPPALKPGDAIGFCSPSSPATHFAPKRFARAKAFLESKGFRLVPGKLTGKQDHYRSGSIAARAEEFNELVRNPDLRCIMSTIGGANSNSLLPYLDYDALKKDPKIIVGYSDMTAILFGIYAQTGLVTFYGPALVASFGEMGAPVEDTYQYFEKLLMRPTVPYRIENPLFWTDEFVDWETQTQPKTLNSNKLRTLNSGKVRGRLITGNLGTMMGVYGSPYMPEIRAGDILLIEDALKHAITVERHFAFLKANGIFDKIGGLVLGKHEQFRDQGTGRKPWEIMMEVIGKPRMPILVDYDCSHTHPMIPLPIGVEAELNADQQSITLLNPSTFLP